MPACNTNYASTGQGHISTNQTHLQSIYSLKGKANSDLQHFETLGQETITRVVSKQAQRRQLNT